MPTYEYICDRCGELLEVFQSFNSKPLKKHETCGGKLTKVLHARGIVFKGSGFYATDAREKKAATTKPAPPTPSSAGASATSSPSD